MRSWVRLGKGNGELPPLDSPAEMMLWWKRWMKQQVPEVIERAAIEAKREDLVLESPVLPPAPASERGKSALLSVVGSISLSTDMAGSAMDSLDRLRSASALYFAKMQEALLAGDRAEADSWRKDWLAAEEKQRHWEKDINGILLARGEMVRKADLIASLTSLAGTLRRNFLSAFKTFGRDVAPGLSEDDLDRFSEPHVEDCFRRLRDSEFSAALRA